MRKNLALIIFLSCWAVFVAALLVAILCTEQGALHQMLTLGYLSNYGDMGVRLHDAFFRYATELGASVPFVVGGLLLFYRVGAGLLVLLSQGVTALVVYPIKVLIAAPRPSRFFAEHFPDVVLHQVDGVRLHQMYSFPSGHTAAVFSLMLCLTFICIKKAWTAPLFFVLAMIGAYSRIYLSQHFAEDVCAGAAVGVVATLLTAFFYYRYPQQWEQQSLQRLVIPKRK